MSAPTFIRPSSGGGLSGFGFMNEPPSSVVSPAKAATVVGITYTVLGAAGLGAGYWLYKKNHPVAGVLIGLLFGPGAIVGPLMLAGVMSMPDMDAPSSGGMPGPTRTDPFGRPDGYSK